MLNDITNVLIIGYDGKGCDDGWPEIFLNKKKAVISHRLFL